MPISRKKVLFRTGQVVRKMGDQSESVNFEVSLQENSLVLACVCVRSHRDLYDYQLSSRKIIKAYRAMKLLSCSFFKRENIGYNLMNECWEACDCSATEHLENMEKKYPGFQEKRSEVMQSLLPQDKISKAIIACQEAGIAPDADELFDELKAYKLVLNNTLRKIIFEKARELREREAMKELENLTLPDDQSLSKLFRDMGIQEEFQDANGENPVTLEKLDRAVIMSRHNSTAPISFELRYWGSDDFPMYRASSEITYSIMRAIFRDGEILIQMLPEVNLFTKTPFCECSIQEFRRLLE